MLIFAILLIHEHPNRPFMAALPPPTKAPPFPIVKPDQKSVLGVAFTFAILPVIAVVLRVISRRMARRPLDASDYCIMAACVFAVALECVSITGEYLLRLVQRIIVPTEKG